MASPTWQPPKPSGTRRISVYMPEGLLARMKAAEKQAERAHMRLNWSRICQDAITAFLEQQYYP